MLGVVALVIAFIPGVDLADLGIGPVLLGLTALDTAGHLAQDAAKGEGGKAIFDGIVGAISIFGGGAVKVLAKNAARAVEPLAELAENPEVTSSLADMLDEGESAVSKLSPVKAILSKVGSRVTGFKSTLSSGFDVAKEIGEDGAKELKGGPFGWVIDGFKDPYAVLGTTKETIEALGTEGLSKTKMIPISLAQGVVSGVKLDERREQIAEWLGLDSEGEGGE